MDITYAFTDERFRQVVLDRFCDQRGSFRKVTFMRLRYYNFPITILAILMESSISGIFKSWIVPIINWPVWILLRITS